MDRQSRIYLQTSQGTRQWLQPSLLSHAQASAIMASAAPGATLAVQQPAEGDGSLVLTPAGQRWRLVPQWVLPMGNAAQVPSQTKPWWNGADGLLYLQLGTLGAAPAHSRLGKGLLPGDQPRPAK